MWNVFRVNPSTYQFLSFVLLRAMTAVHTVVLQKANIGCILCHTITCPFASWRSHGPCTLLVRTLRYNTYNSSLKLCRLSVGGFFSFSDLIPLPITQFLAFPEAHSFLSTFRALKHNGLPRT